MARPIPEIREKIVRYCVYQERSWKDVHQKLRKLECPSWAIEEICAFLTLEGYVNEERFCRLFVRSKFRQLGWGKIKIESELKKHQVSEQNLHTALTEEIVEEDYYQTAMELAQKKLETIRHKDLFDQKKSVFYYLHQKGYEPEHISQLLDSLFPS
ncbi:MAG: recombination regulator RecX [Bacteroidia bacterium]|nr:recombination regulator RecX [Bacteroidia bacterium]